MRWIMVGMGICLQVGAAIFYYLFYRVSRQIKTSELPNLAYKSILKPPFVYLALCGCFWVLGGLCLIIFALIDSDPVLLFFELCLIALGGLILRGFKL